MIIYLYLHKEIQKMEIYTKTSASANVWWEGLISKERGYVVGECVPCECHLCGYIVGPNLGWFN